MIAREHHPDSKVHIFYMDMRAYGKGFEEYYQRGKSDTGIDYIRSRPAQILETDNNELVIFYENTIKRKPAQLRADLIVLSSAIRPSKGNAQLADILGVELDEYGFFKENDPISSPLESKTKGIYLCGCSAGPRDIPDSVAQASGAASKALAAITDTNLLKSEPTFEDEPLLSQGIKNEEPRVGVFVCHCGRNIGGYLDVERVVEHAKSLPNVDFATSNLFTCSDGAQEIIKKSIKENNLNRVVVASCSPRTHESLFRATCKEVGLNEYLFEMANIRDQCSWVHSHDWDEATEKAKVLVSMAVAKACQLEPAAKKYLRVTPEALVIGGGISGLTAARDLAENGFIVHLVEKERELGGILRNLTTLWPTYRPAQEIINEKIEAVAKHPDIRLYLGMEVKDVLGYIGNFKITLAGSENEQKINVGTVIVATGAEEFKPVGYYGYRLHKNIMTLLEYEEALKVKTLPTRVEKIFLISCVGSKENSKEGRAYCCRVGCAALLKTAKSLSQNYPTAHIHILHQDIRLVEKYGEEIYREIRQIPHVHFIRYGEDNKPRVTVVDDKISIKFHNLLSGEDQTHEADLILLATPLVSPPGTKKLSQLFKITIGESGFFQEAHVKLRPLDFATEGIFVCGTAHSPKNVSDSVAQASGAACRASIPMRQGHVIADMNVAVVDSQLCVGCGTCGNVCASNRSI
jgi:heterodisulfide reductase subunit A